MIGKVLLALLYIALILAMARSVVRAHRRHPGATHRLAIRLAIYSALLAGPVYLSGYSEGFTLDIGEKCVMADNGGRMAGARHREDDLLRTSEGLLPLKVECQWEDGSALELVPGYVNPLVYTCLTASAVCAGAGLFAYLRRRSTTLRSQQ
ncbi:hypothetical protein [Streptomyces sp. CB01881]|uniref:hypothetical protein n=1 Tax=Streptomyces sp. CB01881 TaxID=2078691 RepID=UPI000CDC9873|nr:hypothetical protein [Streptomyces sp. CB01881]AUY52492.1 hypothetical protein C2142_30275 [Streptomyces sp. CB01881]TYC71921.1 hypothetical protein EH183_30260 [Streptomyces sp. CB01881]